MRRIKRDATGARILREWLGAGGAPVVPPTAEFRAKCCRWCKYNLRTERIEDDIAEAIREQQEIRHRLSLRTQYDSNLHTCDVCLCNLQLKVWVPGHHLRKFTDKSEFPDWCWLKEV